MKLQITNNTAARLLVLPTGVEILFSYETPVAGMTPVHGLFITEQHHSKTTTKHINAYISGRAFRTLPQSLIDNMFNGCQ
jgi:hypothetical protein